MTGLPWLGFASCGLGLSVLWKVPAHIPTSLPERKRRDHEYKTGWDENFLVVCAESASALGYRSGPFRLKVAQ